MKVEQTGSVEVIYSSFSEILESMLKQFGEILVEYGEAETLEEAREALLHAADIY